MKENIPKFPILKIIPAALISAAIALLAGCNTQPTNSLKQPFDTPETFSRQGEKEMPPQWWQSFNDPNLNQAVTQALGDNFTIKSAWDRLYQAQQAAAKEGAALVPALDYEGSAKRTRRETANQVSYSNNYSLGLAASYEVDLWERISSSRQAAILDAQAARQDVYSAAITLSSNVAKTWYRLAEAKIRQNVIKNQIKTNQQVLELTKTKFAKGQVGASDVFSQQQLLESTRSELNQVEEDIALYRNELSILLGKIPTDSWEKQELSLPKLGSLPELSVPSTVLFNRPDVRKTYKSLQAADLRVASAVADQYPKISISSSVTTSGARTEDLFDDWLANLAGNLAGPVFDAGLRKAEVERRRAVLSEAINNYKQQVLKAYQEVEDSLSQEYHQRANVNYLQSQLELARKVYQRNRANYTKGQVDYLRVLDAQESMQSLERQELIARRQLVERRIDLYRAVAGSIELEQPELADIAKD
jgi:NodT family efflux transporter outer membrane factor (OMF) lipoprotein